MTDYLYDKLEKLDTREPYETLQVDDFKAHSQGFGWYGFTRRSYSADNLTGWKFHVSVDALDIRRATEITAQISQKYGIEIFKVADRGFSINVCLSNNEQRGKSIVLYDTGKQNWPQILQEIENSFEKAIPPIEPVRLENGEIATIFSDKPVTNSNYFSYRNDGGVEYLDASELRAKGIPEELQYNPNQIKDPFANLEIINPLYNRPRQPRDYSKFLAEHFRLRKHSKYVFGMRIEDLINTDILAKKLTNKGIGNRTVWSAVDLDNLYFEADCKDSNVAREIQPLLEEHISPKSKNVGKRWRHKDDVTSLAAIIPESRIEMYALESALKDSGIHLSPIWRISALETAKIKTRKFHSNNLGCRLIEVFRIGKADPLDPLSKLDRIINKYNADTAKMEMPPPTKPEDTSGPTRNTVTTPKPPPARGFHAGQ